MIACDLDAADLSNGLQAAGSENQEQWTDAFAKLNKRLPLGTTDLSNALRKSLEVLGGPDGTIVYIGDGVIRSNILTSSDVRTLVDKLVSSRTSVTSVAIGPVLNVEGLRCSQTTQVVKF